MPSFRTLKLPYLALINVIDNLDGEDIFILSLVSNRTKDLAIASKRSISELSWDLDYLGNEHQQNIHVGIGSCINFLMQKTLEEARETEKLEEWKLNGQLIPMYRTEENVWFIGDRRGREHYFELMDVISAHILEVFQTEDFQLCTDLQNLPEDLFVYKHTRQFSILDFSGSGEIPADHLKFVLEQLEVSMSLDVKHEVPGFRWSGPLKMYRLTIGRAEWLTFKALMNNKCHVMHLKEHIFTGAELNTFLKKWLAGGFRNLEYCFFKSQREHSREEVLQGVETMTSNQANHPENREKDPNHSFYDYHNDLSNIVDIRSKNGVLATIDVNTYTFVMAVWKNV